MFDLWKDSLKDFRSIHRKVLVFESLYLLVTGFVFVPFVAWVFDRFLRAAGSRYLVNGDVLKFVLDVRGFAAFLILGILMVLILFLELGVLVIMSQKIYFGHSASVTDSLATVFRSIPRILGIGLVHLFMLLIAVSPLIDSPLTDFLFQGFNLDILLFNPIRQSRLRLALMGLLAAGLFYLLSRFVFALHLILLNRLNMRKALRKSWLMTRNKALRISLAIIFSNLIYFGLGIAILLLFNYLPLWLKLADRFILIKSATMVFTSYLGFIMTLLVIPLNMSVITRLYYQRLGELGQDATDNLSLINSRLAGKVERWISRLSGKSKQWMRVAFAVLILATFLVNTRVYDQWVFARWHVKIAAHRGDPIQAPENTLPAIEAAVLQAVDYVEIDVQISADGVPVLFHDTTMRRITGRPDAVKDMTLEELKQVDVGRWFSDEFIGTRIPTLEEAIVQVDGRCGLLIDIKLTSEPEITARAVVEQIEAYDLVQSSMVQSFSPRVLSEIRLLNDQIQLGQILTASAGRLEKMDVDFYTISQTMLTESFVRVARSQGRQIWVWTVNSERNIRTVLAYDINGIVTDYPARVQQAGGFEDLLGDQTPVPQLTEEESTEPQTVEMNGS